MKHFTKLVLLLLLACAQLRAQEFFVPPFTVEPTFYERSAGQVIDFWHEPMKVAMAHTMNRGEKAVIFIIDTAGKLDHEDLPTDGNIYAINATPESPDDGHGHGHMCAGIIAAQNNSFGIKGIAPDVLAIPAKGLRNSGAGYGSELAAAIRACADADLGEYNNRIRIISNSWGGPSPVKVIEDAINYAISKGCIITASAGNSGCNTPGMNSQGYPARYANVISVASINKDNSPSSFSSCGEGLDVTAYGYRIYTCDNEGDYTTVNGTSFSNPMIAGLLALDATANYELYRKAGAGANALAMGRLRKFANDLYEPGYDQRTGYGRPTGEMVFDPTSPPTNPTPTPEPPDDVYPERIITVPLAGKFEMMWKGNTGGKYVYMPVEMIVRYRNTKHALAAVDAIQRETEAYWRNRAFVLEPDADHWRALELARHFYELIMNKHNGIEVEVACLRTQENGRTLILNDETKRIRKWFNSKALQGVNTFIINQN